MNAGGQPLTTYFGTKHTKGAYGRGDEKYVEALPQKIYDKLKNLKSIMEMGEKERCPCPALFPIVPLEIQTKKPLEVISSFECQVN
jgi:hypothetical protein